MTDAGFFSWLESEEHRELLYDFLELRSKAIAWYHEPAQALGLDNLGHEPSWSSRFKLFHLRTALGTALRSRFPTGSALLVRSPRLGIAQRPISTPVVKPCWLRHSTAPRGGSPALRLAEPATEAFTSFIQLEKAGDEL